MKSLKARTVFAFMQYSTFIYLVIMAKPIPKEFMAVFGTTVAYYFLEHGVRKIAGK